MTVGIGLHEQRQRGFGFLLTDAVVLDASGQGATHQDACAVTDPLADLLGEVGNGIDQRAIQVEHHQTRQARGEERLRSAHYWCAWASSACMARMTSA